MDLKILPGADVHFCEEVIHQLHQGNVTTVGDYGKCLFLVPLGGEGREVACGEIARGLLNKPLFLRKLEEHGAFPFTFAR